MQDSVLFELEEGVGRYDQLLMDSKFVASGYSLPIVNHIRAPIRIGELKFMHEFVDVQSLVAPVILGTDFLHDNALLLDFTKTPVKFVVTRYNQPKQTLRALQ